MKILDEFMDEWGGREDLLGIKGFRGIHALILTIILILTIGTQHGLFVACCVMLFDMIYRIIVGKPVLKKYLGF